MEQLNSNTANIQQNVDYGQIVKRINKELLEVMQSNRQGEYRQKSKSQLIQEIQNLKRQYNQQLQSLKLKQYLQESTYSFMEQQNKIKYEEIEHERDCLKFQNQKLKQQLIKSRQQQSNIQFIIYKYQTKIKNQQNLIDEYKRSIQEQINLQKEVIKVSFMQKQIKQKNQFQKALKCMQQNYRRKIAQVKQKDVINQYKNDVKNAQKFFSTLNKNKSKPNTMDEFQTNSKQNKLNNLINKQNINRSSTKKLLTIGSYNTLQK